jgi:hypothetical protein
LLEASRSIWFWLLIACGATALVWLLDGRPAVGIDDAYIMLVYGRNLAEGHGFVYYPGGERVEGATSILWTLVSAVASYLTTKPEWPLALLSLILAALTLASAHRALRAISGDIEARARVTLAGMVALWAFCQPDFFAWNVLSLMENGLWSALVTVLVAELADLVRHTDQTDFRPACRLSLCVAALALTRPESLLLVPTLLGCAAILIRPVSSLGRTAVRLLAPLLAFLVVFGALVAFRLWYFGYPWPNTYYVKSTPDVVYNVRQGLWYLRSFLVSRPWNTGMLALLIACLATHAPRAVRGALDGSGRALFLVAAAVLALLALPLPNGGDAFDSFRFYQPGVMLLLAPLALPGGLRAITRPRRPISAAVVGAVVISSIAAIWFSFANTHPLAGEFRAAEVGRRVGTSLAHELADLDRPAEVGVIAAGGIAWTYRGPVVDLLGLNWTAMAHSSADRRGARHGHGAFSPDVFWTRAPDLMVLGLQTGAFCEPDAISTSLHARPVNQYLRGMTDTDEFGAAYEAGCVGEGESSVVAFFSRAWLRDHRPPSYRPL